ncbi:MAG: hypothetical protein M3375_01540 [Actinomycetota bacterium]|nr:hypothetical protein [Actinomycetota bacterium]
MHDAAPTFIRWLWVWITIGALVVVVVIGFLIGIVSSLSSIDDGLFEADQSVASIGGDVRPLPDYIQHINRDLTRIDKSLKPISGQADDILASLGSIRGRLGSVDASLVDTDASLSDTSASLVDTSGQLGNITSLLNDTAGQLGTISTSLIDTSDKLERISPSLVSTAGVLRRISPSLVNTSGQLVSVRRLAGRIDRTLKLAQRTRSLGTHGIWRRVRFINGGPFRRGGDSSDLDTSIAGPNANPNGLTPVKADAGNILGGLRQVNRHLTSICEAPVLQLNILNLVRDGPC